METAENGTCSKLFNTRQRPFRDFRLSARPLKSHAPVSVERFLGRIGYVLVVLVVLLAPTCFSAWTLNSGYIKKVILETLVLAELAIWTAQTVLAARVEQTVSAVNPAILLYWLVCGLSIVWSDYPLAAIRAFWKISTLIGLYFGALSFAGTRRRIRGLLTAACFAGTLVACYGLVQAAGWDPISWGRSARDRVGSSLANSNILGSYLALTLPLALSEVLGAASRKRRVLGAVCGAACAVCLLLSQAKGAWIATALALLAFAAFARVAALASKTGARNRWKSLWPYFASIAALAALFMPSAVERFRATLAGSARVRLICWQGAVRAFHDRPLLGAGLGAFQVYLPRYRAPGFRETGLEYNTLHAHSEYLETLAEQGLLGLAACSLVVLMLAVVGMRALRRAESESDRWIMCGLMAAVVALLADAFVSVSLRWYVCPAFLWLLAALIVSMSNVVLSGTVRKRHELRLGPWAKSGIITLSFGLSASLAWLFIVKPLLGELELRKGANHCRHAQWREAIAHLESAIARDGLQLRARYRLGRAYYEAGDYGKSLRAYEELRSYAPDYSQVHYNMGAGFTQIGEWDAARRAFTKAAEQGSLPIEMTLTQVLSMVDEAQRTSDPSLSSVAR